MNEKEVVKIVVLQRGWVCVGRFSKDGDQCKLEDAYIIRNWGTQQGLGELRNGPLKDTVLDYAGTVSFNELTTVLMIDCDDSWLEQMRLRQMAK
jgi:hypothetical protein